jgi:hypothetical protein
MLCTKILFAMKIVKSIYDELSKKGLLKQALFAVALLGWILFCQSCSGGSSGSSPDGPSPNVDVIASLPSRSDTRSNSQSTPTIPPPEGESHWLEAEYPTFLAVSMEEGYDSEASNSAFLWVSAENEENMGSATYELDINAAGDYVIWARVLSPDGNADSFFVNINQGLDNEVPQFVWEFSSARTWHWEKIHPQNDPDAVFDFQSGNQNMIISNREKGAKIDKILVTHDLNYSPNFAEVLEIDTVWSGHVVGFYLLTGYEYQYVAYYNEDRQMIIAARELGSNQWTYHPVDSFLGWDSHNSVTMALDYDDQLHVCGNMHNDPLVYFRTHESGNIHSLARIPGMLGAQEESVSYPQFFDFNGYLAYHYRDGYSGNGRNFFNVYIESEKKWYRLFEGPLFDGTIFGSNNTHSAYYIGPVKDAEGMYHMIWMWRENSDAATCHHLSHAQSLDLINWEDSAGRPIELPITLENGEIIDPVPVGGGLLNSSFYVGFDSQDRLVVTYHKYDVNDTSQIYNARLEGDHWQIYQMSDWQDQWIFGGGGSLPSSIPGQEAVRIEKDGSLTQAFTSFDSSGVWLIDESSMRVAGNYTRKDPVWIPGSLYAIEADCPECRDHDEDMQVRWKFSEYQETENIPEDFRYFLRWESLDANRDLSRDYIPPASILRLYTSVPYYLGEYAENLP